MKAMILAAGRGERLRPLSDTVPKPLLEINGLPLITHHIVRLKQAGIREFIINLFYLGHLIQERLKNGEEFGVNITYSLEKTKLDTGGGVISALPFLGKEPFLLVSSDIWTNYDFQSLVNLRLKSLAHLVMVPNPSYHPEGDFYLHQSHVSLTGPSPRLTYANIGLYHPDLFQDFLHHPPFPLSLLLKKAIPQRKITGEVFKQTWENIGTVEQYKKVTKSPGS